MKIKILFIFLIVPLAIFGQNTEKEYEEEIVFDTIYISRNDFIKGKSQRVTDTIISTPYALVNYLVGTTVLKNTFSQISAYFDYGLVFDKVVPNSNCGEYREEEYSISITNIEKSDTLLIIEFKYVKGCMHDVLCDLEIIDDEILDLKYIPYGIYGESDACFSLTCYIKIKKEEASKDFSNIKYVMLNSRKKTLVKLENK